jgi:uncharacterized protein YkwD
VLAEGVYGPEVTANFPVYCGVQAPRTLRVEVEEVGAEVDALDVARSNFAALNNQRTRQGSAALQWDNAAAAVAEAHSQDMLANNFVGHDSPRTGDVEARFRRAGIAMAVLRENVARGYGPRGIHESLMASPGHRVNMLAADVTHVGIGAVIGAPETSAAGAPRPIFLTQNFYAKIGGDLPADPVAALQSRVDQLRKAGGLPAITWDPALFGNSQKLAEGIAAGKKKAAEAAYDATLEALPYKTVQHHEVLAPSFAALDGLKVWQQRSPGVMGLGVAQVTKGGERGIADGDRHGGDALGKSGAAGLDSPADPDHVSLDWPKGQGRQNMPNQHVVPHNNGWAVKPEDGERASSVHSTQRRPSSGPRAGAPSAERGARARQRRHDPHAQLVRQRPP